ncbi:MAG: tetratricopeptide repeat protein [Candidatus Rokubacteria bacterium]|nr:tetratricopeptide repeat protein [Candidatus Rokubacteria bacterium]
MARLLSRAGVIPLAIALLTLVVFAPALSNGFVDWDDDRNFLLNPAYRGLGWAELRWMLTTVLMGHWIPLTWLTLGLDYAVWGMNPLGYHLTSLLLHAANGALFYALARRLLILGMPGLDGPALSAGAATAALFFALHPLRAESVAWVTERRDVLSGLFFLLALLGYLGAQEAEGPARRRLLAGSLVAYAAALMSKSIVMTLPLVLVLIDVYPLGRLGPRFRDWLGPRARAVWVEKAPYAVLAITGGAIAFYAVWANAFLTPVDRYPLAARVTMAAYSLWFYVSKTFLPLDLIPLYELPARVDPLEPRFLGSALAALGLTAALVLLRRRVPAGLTVWLAYCVMLGPVANLIHHGHQLASDRYSYLSCLGWALFPGAAVAGLVAAGAAGTVKPTFARLALAGAAVWILGLAALTTQQIQTWRDTETLWRHAIEVDPACALCRNQLGAYLGERGLLGPAIAEFEAGLRRRPDYVGLHGNLGLALLKVGRSSDAVDHFRAVLARYPNNFDARSRLGIALIREGRLGEAVEHLAEAVRLHPAHAGALTNLGIALTGLERPAEAIPYIERAIAANGQAPLARWALARAYRAAGNPAAAQEQADILRRLDPRLADALDRERAR